MDTTALTAGARADLRPAHAAPVRRIDGHVVRPLLLAALVTGGAADLLLRSDGVGAPLAAWLLLLTVTLGALQHRGLGQLPRGVLPLLTVAGASAISIGVRDATTLTFVNALAALSALALAAATGRPGSTFDLARTRMYDGLTACVRVVPGALVGAIPFALLDVRPSLALPARHRYAAELILRAVAMSLIAAGGSLLLLTHGDPVFATLVGRSLVLPVDLATLARHLTFTGIFGWLSAGLLAPAMRPSPELPARSLLAPRLSRLDVAAVLGGLNVVFAAFIATQLRLLFGGRAYLDSVTGLTVTEYARHGFFTLEVVGGAALVGLLAMHAMLALDSPGIHATFRRLATVTLVLTATILASAAVRMGLYVEEYGLTTDRLYTFAAMLWMTLAFCWFRFTTLGLRPHRFTIGALTAAWGIQLALNLVNPEQLVVAVNARRAMRGQPFDLAHAVNGLSADAVPGLVRLLAAPGAPLMAPAAPLGGTDPSVRVRQLLERWSPRNPSHAHEHGWTVADARAHAAVAAHAAQLRAIAFPGAAPRSNVRPITPSARMSVERLAPPGDR